MKRSILFAAVLALFGICACQPDETKTAPGPVVTKVTTSTDSETEVTSVSLNESIAIFGENFVDVIE